MAKKKALRVDIVTIFPEMVEPYLHGAMLGRGQRAKALDFRVHQLRKWTHDRHQTVDDRPFGGGPGMVMKLEPLFEALQALKVRTKEEKDGYSKEDTGDCDECERCDVYTARGPTISEV